MKSISNGGFGFMKLLFAIFLSITLPFSAFAGCAQKAESHALDLRALQSSMMVAALSCDQQSQYNRFIRKYQDDFADGGEEIKAYFKRTYGFGYERELNRFITNLANKATKSSMQKDSDTYCEQSAATFKKLFSLKTEILEEFAEQKRYASLHGVNSCS